MSVLMGAICHTLNLLLDQAPFYPSDSCAASTHLIELMRYNSVCPKS